MKYKDGLRIVREMNVAGGAGGVFGYGGNAVGQHGGAVGNSDFYATGDARIPKVLGAGGNDPYEFVKGKKGKKNKKGKSKVPVYRRTFMELMGDSVSEIEYDLNCLLYTENPQYQQIIKDLLLMNKISFVEDKNCVIFEGTDDYIQNVILQVQGILTEEVFTNNEIVALIGEMDLNEPVSDNVIPGGKAENKTIEDFYHKYDSKGYYDIKDFKEHRFIPQLKKGIKVEMEHTTDKNIAREIATDHLWEDLDYYDKLAKIEKNNE